MKNSQIPQTYVGQVVNMGLYNVFSTFNTIMCVFIYLPVVWRKAHANNVSMDINDVVQGIQNLILTLLFARDRTTSRHLVRLDPLNTWKGRATTT